MTQRQLSLKDITLGMEVYESELSTIFDTHIILRDANIVGNDIYGKIAYIGTELNDESDKISLSNKTTYGVYNDKDEIEGNLTYDE